MCRTSPMSQVESIKLEYRLPAEMHNQFQPWQRSEWTQFPEDRAEQERRNRAEFAEKARAGRIARRRVS